MENEMLNTASQIADLIGVESYETWDDIYADGIWFRVQPKGCGLDHDSECSDGSYSSGVHVHQTLEQTVTQEGRWCMGGQEVVVIRGPKELPDTGDVEGWTLAKGSGEIVGRAEFDALCEERDEQ